MTKRLSIAVCVLLALTSVAALGESSKEQDKAQKIRDRRRAIDAMAVDSMTRLFKESERAGALYDDAVAYAVFDNFKVAFLVSGNEIDLREHLRVRDRADDVLPPHPLVERDRLGVARHFPAGAF